MCKRGNRGSAGQSGTRSGWSKACTHSCDRSTVCRSPRTGTGPLWSWPADRRLLSCAQASALPALPGALPVALVPGAQRHICHSIILSGLPGSHYFTPVIIYSSAEPSACGRALTSMSLTAGQEPHSGRINHRARQQGACVPRERRSRCRHEGPVSTSISPQRNLPLGVSELDEP